MGMRNSVNPRGGGGNVKPRKITISSTATGVVANVHKYLPTGATWSKSSGLAGVTIGSNGDASLASAIGAGNTLSGVVAGTYTDGTGKTQTVSYNLTLAGAVTVPAQVGVVSTTVGNGQILLAWSAPANGGSAITDYLIEYKPTASAIWMPVSDAVSASTGATVSGLTNDVSYDFRVYAVNGVGVSVVSATVSATPVLATYDYPIVFTSAALNAMPVRLVNLGNGNYSHDFTETPYIQATTRYVRSWGNDANGGTDPVTDAKATIQNIMTGSNNIHIDCKESGAIFAPYSCPTGKSFSIEGHADGTTWVGARLTSAQVTSITLNAAGRYTVTLNTGGSVSGFIDRRGFDIYGGYHTSYSATSAAEIQSLFQANGDGGIFRATNSILGLFDGAVIDNARIDNDLLMWAADGAEPETLVGTAQVFTKNLNLFGGVGGNPTVTPVGSKRIRVGGGRYGSHTEPMRCGGWSILKDYQVRACRVSGSDAIDYEQDRVNVRFAEINVTSRGAGTALADNASTGHGCVGVRLDSRYIGGQRVIHDVGESMIAIENCESYFDYMTPGNVHLALGRDSDVEGASTYIRKFRCYGTPTSPATTTNGNFMIAGDAGSPVVNSQARIYCLDNSMVGKIAKNSAGADILGTKVIDLSGARPTANAVLYSWHAATSTLYQTGDTSTPVTAAGQNVGRIDLGNGAYLTCTGVTYQNGGGLHWFVMTESSRMYLRDFTRLTMEDDVHLILTAAASDTSVLPLGVPAYWIDARSGGGAAYRMPAIAYFPKPTYMADKTLLNSGDPTNATAPQLRSALYAGGTQTLTIKHMSMAWDGTRTMSIGSGTTSSGGGIDGNMFGGEILRGDDTFLAARQTASSAFGGKAI